MNKKVYINGKAYSFTKEIGLETFLLFLDFNKNNIALEYNKKVISLSQRSHIKLKNNDIIEIVSIVGGG